MSSYPGISQYKSGFGRVSFFQMLALINRALLAPPRARGATVRWTAVDVPDAPPPAPPRRLRKGEVAAEPAVEPTPSSSAEALDRIIVPEEARLAIASLIQPGASLVVSDQGLGRETTAKGTDFIVLTR